MAVGVGVGGKAGAQCEAVGSGAVLGHPLLQDMLGMHSPALGSLPQTLPKPEPETINFPD